MDQKNITVLACRLCSMALDYKNSLCLETAPAGAQHFLDTADIDDEDKIKLIIATCDYCGLVQSVSPVVKYYRNVITAAGLSAEMRSYREQKAIDFCNKFNLTGKKVVEIGCYKGYFTDILKDVGMEACGTEWESKFPRTPKGNEIISSYPNAGEKIRNYPFHAFFCLNFLEHAPQPRLFLRGIWENLADDAVGLIEVPNYSHQVKLNRIFDYVADHVSYFSKETLEVALSISGFSIKEINETRNGENIEVWVEKRMSINLVSQEKDLKELVNVLNKWLWEIKTQKKRLAFWGASHQALTLLGMVDFKGAVGIFDSAGFKQGRYAPVTRLPILEPSQETLNEVDVILIIASGYHFEINENLRKRYKFKKEVYAMHGDCIKYL